MTASDVTAISDKPVTAAQIQAIYPAAKFENPTKAYAAALGDFKIACQHLKFADLIVKRQPNVWAYQFAPATVPDYVPGGTDFPAVLPWYCSWGIFHASDLQYWFKDFRSQDATPENLTLSSNMRAYLTNFASKGDPNGGSLSYWPSLRSSPKTVLNFASTINPIFDARTEHNCSFWANYNLQE